jgi:hypothetical protein
MYNWELDIYIYVPAVGTSKNVKMLASGGGGRRGGVGGSHQQQQEAHCYNK